MNNSLYNYGDKVALQINCSYYITTFKYAFIKLIYFKETGSITEAEIQRKRKKLSPLQFLFRFISIS